MFYIKSFKYQVQEYQFSSCEFSNAEIKMRFRFSATSAFSYNSTRYAWGGCMECLLEKLLQNISK
ncbi:CLUMA_CG003048, isoform A [Clunio marinus]|uniref:CLUMA_CG003048, isoform A n=1 Tax=Clunio marinus TaxID=568069 RepID=A0A1J1HSW7_9DIPT|nr:CLUMA_CG003048, isoform A [Clunio marinus]